MRSLKSFILEDKNFNSFIKNKNKFIFYKKKYVNCYKFKIYNSSHI